MSWLLYCTLQGDAPALPAAKPNEGSSRGLVLSCMRREFLSVPVFIYFLPCVMSLLSSDGPETHGFYFQDAIQ